MKKIWKIDPVDDSVVSSIQHLTGLPKQLASALANRNILTPEQLDKYLFPSLSKMTSYSLFNNIDKAITRIWNNINNRLPILVYGDFDVDGLTSSSLLTKALRDMGAIADVFVPNRHNDGYGFSLKTIDPLLERYRPNLIITTDCGINSNTTVDYLKSKNIDVIITDHHEPDHNVCSPYVIINPKFNNPDELTILAGVGVALKLVHGLLDFGVKNGYLKASQIDLSDYIDMAAVGTIADVVPLINDNRIIVKEGLNKISKSKFPGLRALLKICGISKVIDTYSISFKVAPRINSAGRLGSSDIVLELLLSEEEVQATEFARSLDKINTRRKETEKQTADNAYAKIDLYFDPLKHFGIVIASDELNPGLAGIIASRLVSKYNRPCVVLGINKETNIAKGSCRSIHDVDLLNILDSCKDILNKYGGHKAAAGVEISVDKIQEFTDRFNNIAKDKLSNKDISQTIVIDDILSVTDITWDFFDKLSKLQPFGNKNSEPIWCIKNTEILSIKPLGKDHVKLYIGTKSNPIEAIIFNCTEDKITSKYIDIVFHLRQSSWFNNNTLQLIILDIKFNE